MTHGVFRRAIVGIGQFRLLHRQAEKFAVNLAGGLVALDAVGLRHLIGDHHKGGQSGEGRGDCADGLQGFCVAGSAICVWGSDLWLLMGGAVDAAAYLAHRVDVQGDNLATGVKVGQNGGGFGIGILVAKLGRDHRAIADIIIDI